MSERIPTVGQRGDEVQPRHPESVVGHHLQPGLARLVSSLLQQVAPGSIGPGAVVLANASAALDIPRIEGSTGTAVSAAAAD
jgi:hypothetical protein